jgi:hypothetical protein
MSLALRAVLVVTVLFGIPESLDYVRVVPVVLLCVSPVLLDDHGSLSVPKFQQATSLDFPMQISSWSGFVGQKQKTKPPALFCDINNYEPPTLMRMGGGGGGGG